MRVTDKEREMTKKISIIMDCLRVVSFTLFSIMTRVFVAYSLLLSWWPVTKERERKRVLDSLEVKYQLTLSLGAEMIPRFSVREKWLRQIPCLVSLRKKRLTSSSFSSSILWVFSFSQDYNCFSHRLQLMMIEKDVVEQQLLLSFSRKRNIL